MSDPVADALRKAAAQFREYERHHTAKGAGLKGDALREANDKADRNMQMAIVCEQALEKLAAPVDQTKLPRLHLTPASEGGFVVERFDFTKGPGYPGSLDFAGALDDCLDYMRRRMTTPGAGPKA